MFGLRLWEFRLKLLGPEGAGASTTKALVANYMHLKH